MAPKHHKTDWQNYNWAEIIRHYFMLTGSGLEWGTFHNSAMVGQKIHI